MPSAGESLGQRGDDAEHAAGQRLGDVQGAQRLRAVVAVGVLVAAQLALDRGVDDRVRLALQRQRLERVGAGQVAERGDLDAGVGIQQREVAARRRAGRETARRA